MTHFSRFASAHGEGKSLRTPGLRAVAFVACLALSLCAGPPMARAQADDPVVARVNGAEIRASDLALAEEDVGANIPPGPGKRDSLVTFLADMMLVAQAAEAKKLAETPEFKRRTAYYRTKILMDLMLQSEAKAAVGDEAMQKLYDEAIKQIGNDQEVHARHILVESEDEAKALLAELKKGADFAELAKQKSKDPGAANGGDLGYFTKDQMVPEFAEVAFKLDKGQLSNPVKTQFGWHVIRVEDKRQRQPPSFDQVKDQLESYLTRRAQAQMINKLRESGKIERLDPKPAEPEQKSAPPASPKNGVPPNVPPKK